MDEVTEARFWAKVSLDGDCWEWQAGCDGKGYGRFYVDGVSVSAHRFALEITKGPLPQGMVPDHLCRNHRCVRPDHLEAVTQQENIRRGVSPAAVHAAQTHCKRGHPLSGDNLCTGKPSSPNSRHCRTCRRMARHGRITAVAA